MTVINDALPGPDLAGQPYRACEEPARIWCPNGCYGGQVPASRYCNHVNAWKTCETCKGLGWTEADGSPAEDAELLSWAATLGSLVR